MSPERWKMRLHHGVHAELEEMANELIRQSLAGVTARSAKSDILTPWKERDRYSREVYSSSGTVDAATRRGMFHRAWNPQHAHLNSRDGIAPGRRIPTGLAEFMDKQWPTGIEPSDED
jgi:hypothetical protein